MHGDINVQYQFAAKFRQPLEESSLDRIDSYVDIARCLSVSDGVSGKVNTIDKLESVDYICRLYSSIEEIDRVKMHRGDKEIKTISTVILIRFF